MSNRSEVGSLREADEDSEVKRRGNFFAAFAPFAAVARNSFPILMRTNFFCRLASIASNVWLYVVAD